jgi:hypothetical protein
MRITLYDPAAIVLTVAAAASGQIATFEGHPAITFGNDKLQLLVLKQGASVASVVLRDDPEKLSPLWDPARMARELGRPVSFSSGTGQFLCVDGFGGVSAEERAAGLPGHGEAHLAEWESRLEEGRLTLTTRLPHTQERITRVMTIVPGENIAYSETTIESELDFDRPILWAEHATIGSPFLAPGVTVVDLPAIRSKTRPWEPGKSGLSHRLPSDVEFTWPMAPTVDGAKVNLRAAPIPRDYGDHTASLVDPARKLVYVTAINPDKRLIVGWVFRPQEYPWVQNWENYPATGKLARGLEFSTQPFDLPRRTVVTQNNLWGTLLYRWLPARSKVSTKFAMFFARCPDGMIRVDDVRKEGGFLVIEDRAAGRSLRLRMSEALD